MPNQNWVKIEKNGFEKANYPIIKKFLLGLLAGFYVGIGFSAMLIINGTCGDTGIGKFLGGAIFCLGILMCMFVSASLYTANCSIYSCVIKKTIKRRVFYLDLLVTLLGNWVGSILIAAMMYGIGSQFDKFQTIIDQIASVSQAKVDLAFWKTFLSGIITNVLVIACVISLLIWDNKIVGWLTTLVMITGFAICGFQHVVANQFITALGGFYGDLGGDRVGKIFYNCLIPSALGNWVGGVGLILIYWLIWDKFNVKKQKTSKKSKSKE